jgi:hypothetical protein
MVTLDYKKRHAFMSAEQVFRKHGIFGTDGRVSQGEWRFTPANDVHVFIDIVERVMEYCKTYVVLRQNEQLRGSNLSTAGILPNVYPYGMGVYNILYNESIALPESIGLHIHFGVPNVAHLKRYSFPTLLSALDLFLAPVVKLFEPEAGRYVRTLSGYYGTLSDFEHKPYGLEYKTLPSCIDNKQVFTGVFAIAKALAFEVNSKKITQKMLDEFYIVESKVCNDMYLRTLAKSAYMFIKRTCRFYQLYKNEIDAIFDLALSADPRALFATEEDIFSYWGIKRVEDGGIENMLRTHVLSARNRPVKEYKNLEQLNQGNKLDKVSLNDPDILFSVSR